MKFDPITVKGSLLKYTLLYFIVFFLIVQQSYGQRVMGYFPNYNYTAAKASGIQYAKLTHLYYFALNPYRTSSGQTDGSLWYNDPYSWFTTASFNDVLTKARAANPTIKVVIVTGGAPGSDSDLSTRLQYIGSNAGVLNTFCNNIINFIVANNLNGWDLDWEFPNTAAARTAHQNLLAKMRFKIDSLKTASCKYYEISAAVGGGYTDRLTHTCWNPAHTDYITQTALNYLDQVNIMTYDGNIGSAPCSFASHEDYNLVVKAYTDWTADYTIAASKINIGVGFYDNSGTAFNSIGNVNTRYNATYWNGGSGCPNMQSKIDYIHTQGGSGTFIWELTQDNLCSGTVPACYSLLDCMYQYTLSSWGTWVSPTVSSCTAPVQLISFTGTSTSTGNQLQWATATETNNDRFEIEQSSDGVTFHTIGTVNGQGNSSSVTAYSFLDGIVQGVKNYYRLHQFDIDGKSTYSQTIVVFSASQELLLTASPNPFIETCTITISGLKGESIAAEFIVYDLLGHVYETDLMQLSNSSFEVGKTLPQGMYLCALKTGQSTSYLRIVKAK